MRQAVNNLQSTHSGFNFVSADNVFKVCDQPNPVVMAQVISSCLSCDVDAAAARLNKLWTDGYSGVDIVGTVSFLVYFLLIFDFEKLFCPCINDGRKGFNVNLLLLHYFSRVTKYLIVWRADYWCNDHLSRNAWIISFSVIHVFQYVLILIIAP
jgi:hypothetical protein